MGCTASWCYLTSVQMMVISWSRMRLMTPTRRHKMIGVPGTTDKQITVDVDASIVILRDGRVGLKILRVKRLVLVYTDGG